MQEPERAPHSLFLQILPITVHKLLPGPNDRDRTIHRALSPLRSLDWSAHTAKPSGLSPDYRHTSAVPRYGTPTALYCSLYCSRAGPRSWRSVAGRGMTPQRVSRRIHALVTLFSRSCDFWLADTRFGDNNMIPPLMNLTKSRTSFS